MWTHSYLQFVPDATTAGIINKLYAALYVNNVQPYGVVDGINDDQSVFPYPGEWVGWVGEGRWECYLFVLATPYMSHGHTYMLYIATGEVNKHP